MDELNLNSMINHYNITTMKNDSERRLPTYILISQSAIIVIKDVFLLLVTK